MTGKWKTMLLVFLLENVENIYYLGNSYFKRNDWTFYRFQKQNFEKDIFFWWELSDNRIGISLFIQFNFNTYLASLESSLSANLYTNLAAHDFTVLKNCSRSNFVASQL